ncbi:MAG TPA: tetratricopeptide repeat protein [Geobacterales bacterium]|nr:tetratricopeptide repeat protein [Geobacterales bacterium]
MGNNEQWEGNELFDKGKTALDNGHYHLALVCFERATASIRTPELISCLAVTLAAVRQEYRQALELCEEAVSQEPGNSLHYLNMGRVLLRLGEKGNAITIFRKGLACGKNPEIVRELERIGSRKPPVFPSLPRNHFLNKYLGIILYRLGLR